jgi:hypothetical protein
VGAGVERAGRDGGEREGGEREGSDHGGCDAAYAEQARRDLTRGVDRRHQRLCVVGEVIRGRLRQPRCGAVARALEASAAGAPDYANVTATFAVFPAAPADPSSADCAPLLPGALRSGASLPEDVAGRTRSRPQGPHGGDSCTIATVRGDPRFRPATWTRALRRAGIRRLRRGRIRLSGVPTCPSGRIVARITARLAGRRVVLAKLDRGFDGCCMGAKNFTLRRTASARRRLRGRHSIKVRVVMRIYDATGASQTMTRALRLKTR